MKKIILTFVLLPLFYIHILAQSDERAVRQTMEEFRNAMVNNNADAASRLLADDYSFINLQGVLMGKKQRISMMKSGKEKFDSFNYEDVVVRLYGTTAILTTRVMARPVGKEIKPVLTTMVMVKEDGRWQIVASQGTFVNKNAEIMK